MRESDLMENPSKATAMERDERERGGILRERERER